MGFQAAEPNEVEFSSRWIVGDSYGAVIDGAFFLMDSLAQVQGLEQGMSSKTTEQFLPKRRGVVAMVSELKHGHDLPGLRRPAWSPQQSTLQVIKIILDCDALGSPQQQSFPSGSSASWTVAAFEVTTANLVISDRASWIATATQSPRQPFFAIFFGSAVDGGARSAVTQKNEGQEFL